MDPCFVGLGLEGGLTDKWTKYYPHSSVERQYTVTCGSFIPRLIWACRLPFRLWIGRGLPTLIPIESREEFDIVDRQDEEELGAYF